MSSMVGQSKGRIRFRDDLSEPWEGRGYTAICNSLRTIGQLSPRLRKRQRFWAYLHFTIASLL